METLLLIVISLFIPPLTAFLIVGLSTHFWINLILTLLGWFPGVLHALYLIFTRGSAPGRR